jgi:hypothetical protein
MIRARFVLQRDEFAKAYRVAVRNLPAKIRWAGWAQCGLLLALMLTGLAYRPEGELAPVSLIIVLLVWLVFVTGRIGQGALTSVQFARMIGVEIWYEFDPAGVRCGMPNSNTSSDWSGFVKVIETDSLFVLLSSGVTFYTIPKRALAPDEISSLQGLFGDKVPIQHN